jgi:hypothetical protein
MNLLHNENTMQKTRACAPDFLVLRPLPGLSRIQYPLVSGGHLPDHPALFHEKADSVDSRRRPVKGPNIPEAVTDHGRS